MSTLQNELFSKLYVHFNSNGLPRQKLQKLLRNVHGPVDSEVALQRVHGIVEKLSIHGKSKEAETLKWLVDDLMQRAKSQELRQLFLASLHLLLELSVSPQSVEHDVLPVIDFEVAPVISTRVALRHLKPSESNYDSENSEDDTESLPETLVEEESNSDTYETALSPKNILIDHSLRRAEKYWQPQILPPALVSFDPSAMHTLGPGLSSSWKTNFLSEYDMIRETLMAYNGSESVLFDFTCDDVVVKHEFGLTHCSNEVLWNYLSKFANDIKLIRTLRKFTNMKHDVPESAAFSSFIRKKIVLFERETLEILNFTDTKDGVLSLLRLYKSLRSHMKTLVWMNELIKLGDSIGGNYNSVIYKSLVCGEIQGHKRDRILLLRDCFWETLKPILQRLISWSNGISSDFEKFFSAEDTAPWFLKNFKGSFEDIKLRISLLPPSNRLSFDNFIWIRDLHYDFEYGLTSGMTSTLGQLKEKVDAAYCDLVNDKMHFRDHLIQIESVFLFDNMLVMKSFAKKLLENQKFCVSSTQLASWFNLANLEDAGSNIDEKLFIWSVKPNEEPIKGWKHLLDSITLEYKVPPELSTVMTSIVLDEYMLQFRSLLYLILVRIRLELFFKKGPSISHRDRIETFLDYQWTSQLMHQIYLYKNEDTLSSFKMAQTRLTANDNERLENISSRLDALITSLS